MSERGEQYRKVHALARWRDRKAVNPKLARSALDVCHAILERPDLKGAILAAFHAEHAAGAVRGEPSEPER